MSQPDVTVIVPVFNTMPYLTKCLTSLVKQSIGRDRITIVAVDDGSTDGSGEEIDRFAASYPGVVIPVHQPNSGGPASPCNRGLELATGRYVFFVGADDYLGNEALERLVKAADRWESDVVLGKLQGRGGRYVDQSAFTEQSDDVDLYDSRLPYAVGNVKLFRRQLIEDNGLRFPEDLQIGSDQPFTIEAMVRARRISVLNDYTYYYAVRRKDASNITYAAGDQKRLECTTKIIDFVAGLLEPGARRDAMLVRHFDWELAKLLQSDFLTRSQPEQLVICQGIGRLADDYFTPTVRAALDVSPRLRIGLAQAGQIDLLCEVVSAIFRPEGDLLSYVNDGERTLCDYPGFGTGVIGDEFYEQYGPPRVSDVGDRLDLDVTRAEDGGLMIEGRLPVVSRSGEAFADVVLRSIPRVNAVPNALVLADAEADATVVARLPLSAFGDQRQSQIHAHIEPASLITETPTGKTVNSLRVQFAVGSHVLDYPVPVPRDQRSAHVQRGSIQFRIAFREGRVVRRDANRFKVAFREGNLVERVTNRLKVALRRGNLVQQGTNRMKTALSGSNADPLVLIVGPPAPVGSANSVWQRMRQFRRSSR